MNGLINKCRMRGGEAAGERRKDTINPEELEFGLMTQRAVHTGK